MQILEALIKKETHVLKAFIKLRCTFLRRARKAYSNFYDLYKITVRIFEARAVGDNVHEGKYIINYLPHVEIMSWIHAFLYPVLP